MLGLRGASEPAFVEVADGRVSRVHCTIRRGRNPATGDSQAYIEVDCRPIPLEPRETLMKTLGPSLRGVGSPDLSRFRFQILEHYQTRSLERYEANIEVLTVPRPLPPASSATHITRCNPSQRHLSTWWCRRCQYAFPAAACTPVILPVQRGWYCRASKSPA